VAGFIGSPAMNFLEGEVSGQQDDGLQIRLPADPPGPVATWLARVAPQGMAPGTPATLGIRPEHVSVGEGPGRARVLHVEHLGELSQLLLQPEGQADAAPPLLVKTTREDTRLGDVLAFALPAEHCHCFTADGRALPRLAGLEGPR